MTSQLKLNAREHPIAEVTVYQTNRAVVQRRFSVQVKAGQNDILIEHLPTVLEGDSIRVEAETLTKSRAQALTVFDVIYAPPSYRDPDTRSTQNNPELEALEERKAALEAHVTALNGQKSVLEGYSDSVKGGQIESATTESLESFMDVYVTRQIKIYEEVTRLQKEIKGVVDQIKAIRAKTKDDEAEGRTAAITVVLLAEEDGSIDLSLSYVVRRASWSSLYDVRADLGSTSGSSKDSEATPSIKLQYRATITQSTGEDWTGVVLTLSTASPLTGSDIPKIQPLRITAYKPRPAIRYRTQSTVPSPAMYAPPGAYAMSPPPPTQLIPEMAVEFKSSRQLSSVRSQSPPPEFAVYDEGPTVQVREGAISSTYSIDGLSTIPSDGSSHKVSVATIDLSADLEWITVPRTLPSAFLQCKIKNTSLYQLIAGISSVFLDGNFVSKSQIPDVSPQESFSCSLGVDPSVRITYHPQNKVSSRAGGGLMSTKTNVTTFKQRITIKNTRSANIARLVVHDRVPVSEDARVKVTVQQPSEKAIGPISSHGLGISSSIGGSAAGTSSVGKSGADQVLVEKVGKNVIARWAQKDEENGGGGGSRGDGVIEWIATDLKDTLEIQLAYEISTPLEVQWIEA